VVFLLYLLGANFAQSGLSTRAAEVLILCYAEFFLYGIGNGEMRRSFSAKAVIYGNRLKIFSLIIVLGDM
jgi:hypothetical protein